jgi:hypothetical protein
MDMGANQNVARTISPALKADLDVSPIADFFIGLLISRE